MASDIKVQRGQATIATSASTVTLTAGTDYTAPASASKAFCRITATKNLSTVTTDATVDEATAYASVEQADITASVTFTRSNSSATRAVRVDWEIVEYIGSNGGGNEFVVRAVGEIALGATSDNAVTTGAVSGIADDADVLPWITGVRCNSGNFSPPNGMFSAAWNGGGDTVTFTRVRTHNTAATISYAVVEYVGANWKVQAVEKLIVAADTVETTSITAVGATTRAVLHLQQRGGAAVLDDCSYQAWLSAVDTISFYAPVGYVGSSITVRAWVLENTQTGSGEMVVARYDGTNTGGGTFTKTVTAVTLADASVMEMSGSLPQNTGSMPAETANFRLTATTTVTGFRNRAVNTQSYRFATVVWPLVPVGPTITAQPTAQTAIIANGGAASFTVAATSSGGALTYQWQLETGVSTGSYSSVADGSGLTFSGGTTATLSVTASATTATGRRVRCNVTDSNGTTTSNAVALSIYNGPASGTFGPTDADGESAANVTTDFPNAVRAGSFLKASIVLADGTVLGTAYGNTP